MEGFLLKWCLKNSIPNKVVNIYIYPIKLILTSENHRHSNTPFAEFSCEVKRKKPAVNWRVWVKWVPNNCEKHISNIRFLVKQVAALQTTITFHIVNVLKSNEKKTGWVWFSMFFSSNKGFFSKYTSKITPNRQGLQVQPGHSVPCEGQTKTSPSRSPKLLSAFTAWKDPNRLDPNRLEFLWKNLERRIGMNSSKVSVGYMIWIMYIKDAVKGSLWDICFVFSL